MTAYALVALGGALGSVARFWLGAAVMRLTGGDFPWGTVLINILGSFVIGWFAALTAASGRLPASAEWRAFVMTGLCGGFTTFSAFSLQTVELARAGQGAAALANIGLSIAACLAATLLGIAAAGLP